MLSRPLQRVCGVARLVVVVTFTVTREHAVWVTTSHFLVHLTI